MLDQTVSHFQLHYSDAVPPIRLDRRGHVSELQAVCRSSDWPGLCLALSDHQACELSIR